MKMGKETGALAENKGWMKIMIIVTSQLQDQEKPAGDLGTFFWLDEIFQKTKTYQMGYKRKKVSDRKCMQRAQNRRIGW